jgi:uncharacterized protein (TIGR00730 family)
MLSQRLKMMKREQEEEQEMSYMARIRAVCVYCGSSNLVDPNFKTIAQETGKLIARAGRTLVFGGGRVGLMGETSNAALEAGGYVVGIIPEHIRVFEKEHEGLQELIVVDSMHTRKQLMVSRSDAFVILPGGLGTLDEFFEILTWKQLGLHDRPIVILNAYGYWDKLVDLLRHMEETKFARDVIGRLVTVVERVEDLDAALQLSVPVA